MKKVRYNRTIRLNRAKICRHELVTKDGRYCPIGKVAAVLNDIKEIEMYTKFYSSFSFDPYMLLRNLGADTTLIYRTNDSRGLSRKEREKRIKAEFKKAGISIRYHGEYKR